jgi:hypothetical protein
VYLLLIEKKWAWVAHCESNAHVTSTVLGEFANAVPDETLFVRLRAGEVVAV